MPSSLPPPGSYSRPLPVTRTPDEWHRDEVTAGPRCTEPGCPVRYASGESRPCREHDEDVPAGPPLFRWPLPGDEDEDEDEDEAGDGGLRELLLADPSRSNNTLAGLSGWSTASASRCRRQMEAAREICAYRDGAHAAGCWCGGQA